MTTQFQNALAVIQANYASLLDGESAIFGFRLDEITLLSGEVIKVTPGGVTAIVGGNNVGKSTLLREVQRYLARMPHEPDNPSPNLVGSVNATRSGDPSDMFAWLLSHAKMTVDPGNPHYVRVRSQAGEIGVDQIHSIWAQPGARIGPLSHFMCFYANAQGRFGTGGGVEMRDRLDEPPTHPIHVLQMDRVRMAEISEVASSVFGQPLTLDTLARTIRLRVGALEMEVPRIDDVSVAYQEAMDGLPPLDEQGDGLRGFMGVILPLSTATYPVIMIDEPEAFLHPPQAHALGRQLGSLAAERQVQVIVATHDQNFLSGLLDSSAPVSVVRLTRDANGGHAHQLEAQALKDLWSEPSLRYRNVLDGLFHRFVVLAEAESDCSYLRAAADWAYQVGTSTIPPNEVLFVPTGGKDGMSRVARVLNAVSVPVVAAPDLDIVKSGDTLKALAEALGFRWSEEMDKSQRTAKSNIDGRQGPANVSDVLEAIQRVLDPYRDEPYSRSHKDKVMAHLRSGSPWDDVKSYGINAFKGDGRDAVVTLLKRLRQCGIVPVEVGELERLAPEVNRRKGSGWLAEALRLRCYENATTQQHFAHIVTAYNEVDMKSPPTEDADSTLE